MEKDQIIKTLLLWNFWEKDIDTGIPRRAYLDKIKRYLHTDEIVTITGVRRCGKSTILLQALQELIRDKIPKVNTLYVNFEDPNFYNSLNISLLDEIWQAYVDYFNPIGRVYVVLDEAQKIKGWEHWARAMYDRKEKVKIFVTGSNTELLSSEFASVLTGRHLELPVTPLNFMEFMEFKGIKIENNKLWHIKNESSLKKIAAEYLIIGGFPKIALTNDELIRRDLLVQYFNDILVKDIVERHKIKDVNKLKNLALFYSANFTRSYSFNKVKKVADFALSLDSIHRFSHYMENSFLISFLQRFSYSLKNQMQAHRKVYLIDNGMHNAIAFKFSEDKGKLLENAVFQQLRNMREEVYFFAEKKEVDFVCKDGLKIKELINVCYSIDSKETLLRECSALIEGMKYFKLKEAMIITGEGDSKEITDNGFKIAVTPFYKWALGLE